MKLTIHGVGKHSPGEIEYLLCNWELSSGSPTKWKEVNWSQFDEVDGPTLDYGQLRRVLSALASAGRLLFDATVERSSLTRKPAKILRGLANVVEALFLLAIVMVALLPAFTLLLKLGGMVFSFSWSPFEKVLVTLMWAWFAAGFGILIVFVSSVLFALVSRNIHFIAVALCWAVLLVVRPIVYICLVPFTLPVWKLLKESPKLVSKLLVSTVLAAVTWPLFGHSWKELFTDFGRASLLIVAACSLIWIAGQITQLLLGPVLKVLLDIFRYVGEPDHRDQIQRELESVLVSLDTEIVICAHSLGSVIAVDSLVNSTHWQKTHSVTLVTMGSPLRRFFFRFFPGILFPPSARQIYSLVHSRIGAIEWVNVHRPFDQIGGSLRLASGQVGIDASTRQWSRILDAHPGYFGDPIVYNTILRARSRVAGMPVHQAESLWRIPYSMPPSSATAFILRWTPKLSRLVPVLVAVMLLSIPAARTKVNSEVAKSRQKLLEEGVSLPARVENWTSIEGSGEDAVRINHLRFIFDNHPDGFPTDHSVETGSLFDSSDRFFDTAGLSQDVRRDCELLGKAALLQSKSEIPCRSRKPFRLRWLNTTPPIFDLPDYPPKTRWAKELFQWAFWIFWSGGMAAFLGYGIVALGGHLVSVLAGVK